MQWLNCCTLQLSGIQVRIFFEISIFLKFNFVNFAVTFRPFHSFIDHFIRLSTIDFDFHFSIVFWDLCGFLANVLGSRLAKCSDNGQVLGKKSFIKNQSVRMWGVELKYLWMCGIRPVSTDVWIGAYPSVNVQIGASFKWMHRSESHLNQCIDRSPSIMCKLVPICTHGWSSSLCL